MTPDDVFNHLKKTFDDTCRHFPDIMEPYVVRISDITDQQEAKSLMRAGLRETFAKRWPNRFAQPITEQAAE